jgi:hypothetical protein
MRSPAGGCRLHLKLNEPRGVIDMANPFQLCLTLTPFFATGQFPSASAPKASVTSLLRPSADAPASNKLCAVSKKGVRVRRHAHGVQSELVVSSTHRASILFLGMPPSDRLFGTGHRRSVVVRLKWPSFSAKNSAGLAGKLYTGRIALRWSGMPTILTPHRYSSRPD